MFFYGTSGLRDIAGDARVLFCSLVVSSSRRPVVSSSRRLVVSSSRRLVVSSSRRLVVSSSRGLVVSSSRGPAVPSSHRLVISLARFPVILSHSQAFPVNRAPLSCLVVPQSPNRSPLSLTSLNSLISLNSLYHSSTFLRLKNMLSCRQSTKSHFLQKKRFHIYLYMSKNKYLCKPENIGFGLQFKY